MTTPTLADMHAVLLQKRAAWVQVLEIAQRDLPELNEEALMRIDGLTAAILLAGDHIRDQKHHDRTHH